MKKLFLLLLVPAVSFAQQEGQEFKLKGELKLAKPIDWIYIRYNAGSNPVTDSFQTKTGAFKYEGKIAEPTVATLSVKYVQAEGEQRPKVEYMQFFLEPSKMEIVAKDSLKMNSVSGSAGHVDFARLIKQQESYDARLTPLYNDYSNFNKSGNKDAANKVVSAIEMIDAEMKEKVWGDFVRTHASSPVALYALKQYAGYDLDPAKVEPLYTSLAGPMRQWPSAIAFGEQIAIAKKTAVGQYAMDFTQNDTTGNPVSLSSFKGKYVLVDFWASWCGPCRRENPNVVKTFNKYKDKGFTVLGVSLDRPTARDKWLKAISDDGLTWTQVSDLKFWDNAVARQYGIRAIPQNLLLDPQGKIIAKNLRGEDLDRKLGEILK